MISHVAVLRLWDRHCESHVSHVKLDHLIATLWFCTADKMVSLSPKPKRPLYIEFPRILESSGNLQVRRKEALRYVLGMFGSVCVFMLMLHASLQMSYSSNFAYIVQRDWTLGLCLHMCIPLWRRDLLNAQVAAGTLARTFHWNMPNMVQNHVQVYSYMHVILLVFYTQRMHVCNYEDKSLGRVCWRLPKPCVCRRWTSCDWKSQGTVMNIHSLCTCLKQQLQHEDQWA